MIQRATVKGLSPLVVRLDADTADLPVATVVAPDPTAFRASLTVGMRVAIIARPLSGRAAELFLVGRI